MLDLTRRVTRGALVYGGGDLLIKGISFLLLPVYTHYLTPSDYGILSLVTAFNSVLLVLMPMGLVGSLTKMHYDLEDEGKRRELYGTVYLFMLMVSTGLTLVLAALGPTLFRRFFSSVPFQPYLQIGLGIALGSSLSILPMTLLQIRGKALLYRGFTIGRFMASTGLIIVFVVFLRMGALGSLYGQLLAVTAMAGPYCLYTWRHVRLCLDGALLRRSLALGWPLMFYSLAALVTESSDRFFIVQYAPLGDLGVYNVAYQFGWLMLAFLNAVQLVWTPLFFETARRKDASVLFGRFGTYYLMAVTWVALGIALLGREAVLLATSAPFHAAYTVIPVLVLAYATGGVWFMLINQLFLTGNTGSLVWITVAGAVLNMLANIILIPRWGITGAAWATAASIMGQSALLFRLSKRVYPIAFEYTRLLRIIGVSLALFVIGFLFLSEGVWGPLIGKMALLALAYPALLFATRAIDRRELRAASAGIRAWATYRR